MIYIGMNFQFEFFTYGFLFISIILIVIEISNGLEKFFPLVIGVNLLNIGIFSRLFLRKNDIKKIEEKNT